KCSVCVLWRSHFLWRLVRCEVVLRPHAAHVRDPTLSATAIMPPRSGVNRVARGRERERVVARAQKGGPSLDVSPGVCPCVSCTDSSYIYKPHFSSSFHLFSD